MKLAFYYSKLISRTIFVDISNIVYKKEKLMKKMLLALIGATCTFAYAGSPVVFPIACNGNVMITESATLAQVQQCQIDKQKTSSGMYEVKFYDINKKKYECFFPNNTATATINHCSNG